VWVAILAAVEILLGSVGLYWCFAHGIRDESSTGTVFFLWGAIAALFALLIPGVLLLFPRPFRWLLQPLPALLAFVVIAVLLLGLVNK
jgi:hypothetical protein